MRASTVLTIAAIAASASLMVRAARATCGCGTLHAISVCPGCFSQNEICKCLSGACVNGSGETAVQVSCGYGRWGWTLAPHGDLICQSDEPVLCQKSRFCGKRFSIPPCHDAANPCIWGVWTSVDDYEFVDIGDC